LRNIFNFYYWLLSLIFLLQRVVLFKGLGLLKNGEESTIWACKSGANLGLGRLGSSLGR